jgi:intracellular multiplication protein IcmP
MRPPPQPRPSWPSNDDTAGFNLIVILVGVWLGAYLVWTNYHGTISAAVMAVMHREILLIDHFTHRFDVADQQMAAADPNGVTLRDLYGIAQAVGMFFRIPATVFIVLLAAICTIRAAPSRYKRGFDLDALIREQALVFRSTAAFVRRHLRLVPPPAGAPRPADYALTAEEWIDRFARNRHGAFDESAAHAALAVQLGARWKGPQDAAPVVRCLFAAFALHLSQRREEALSLLGDASAALGSQDEAQPSGPDQPLALPASILAKADALIADPKGLVEARAVTARHAYATTAMMTLLNTARLHAGVLAPAQFAWLKLVDRSLWYALHSLGYETEGFGRYLHPNPRVEALGARGHWAVERLVGAPVVAPSPERAIEALRRQLPEIAVGSDASQPQFRPDRFQAGTEQIPI